MEAFGTGLCKYIDGWVLDGRVGEAFVFQVFQDRNNSFKDNICGIL